MRHLVLLGLAFVLASSAPASSAQAQTEEGCTQWWCRWGVPRDTVDARVEAMRSSYDVEIPVNTEERVCVDWKLIENKACYMFDGQGLSAYSSTSYNRSPEEIGEEMVGADRAWGGAMGYYADFTPVGGWERRRGDVHPGRTVRACGAVPESPALTQRERESTGSANMKDVMVRALNEYRRNHSNE